MLSLGDIAKRFKLSADLVQSTINAHLNSQIEGRIESGILYTESYIRLIKAQVRQILSSCLNALAHNTTHDIPTCHASNLMNKQDQYKCTGHSQECTKGPGHHVSL